MCRRHGLNLECGKYLQSQSFNNNNEHAHASQLNSFTHLRALMVLHDCGVFWLRQRASLGRIPPVEVAQILVLRLGCYSFPRHPVIVHTWRRTGRSTTMRARQLTKKTLHWELTCDLSHCHIINMSADWTQSRGPKCCGQWVPIGLLDAWKYSVVHKHVIYNNYHNYY
jgi:hypothetical protein